jgi:hypothetical protein
MKTKHLKIIKEETYRSKPYVNMTDDMIRATISCKRYEWHIIKKFINTYLVGKGDKV